MHRQVYKVRVVFPAATVEEAAERFAALGLGVDFWPGDGSDRAQVRRATVRLGNPQPTPWPFLVYFAPEERGIAVSVATRSPRGQRACLVLFSAVASGDRLAAMEAIAALRSLWPPPDP